MSMLKKDLKKEFLEFNKDFVHRAGADPLGLLTVADDD